MNKVQAFHAALGEFIVLWAQLELGLDLLVLIARDTYARNQRPSKLPHQLSQKIRFIRRATDDLPSWDAHRAVINTFLDEIEAVAPTRHDFVHGAMIEHHEKRNIMMVTIGRLLQPHNIQGRGSIKVTTTDVAKTANRIRELGDRTFDMAEMLNAARR